MTQTLNAARVDQFFAVYAIKLAEAAAKHPDQYPWIVPGPYALTVERVAAKMRASTEKGIGGVSIDGHAWKNTCRALGIKCTYAAITAFLATEP